jgi:hypothetical protein
MDFMTDATDVVEQDKRANLGADRGIETQADPQHYIDQFLRKPNGCTAICELLGRTLKDDDMPTNGAQ